MNSQYEPLAVSSFLLWLDNRILNNAAFYNYSSQLYPIPQIYNGLYSYSTPYAQLVSDTSISGANVMTGVYLNGKFVTKGQSGLYDIDYTRGIAHFTSPINNNVLISGNYAIKEVNTVLPSFYDLKTLFETKLFLKSVRPTIPTGIQYDTLTYPAIFITSESSDNQPFAIGGLDQTRLRIGCYIFAESLLQSNNINSIIRDSVYKFVPFINENEMPFTPFNGYTGTTPYSYANLTKNKLSTNYGMLVENVDLTSLTLRGLRTEIENLTTAAFFSHAEVTLWKDRVTS